MTESTVLIDLGPATELGLALHDRDCKVLMPQAERRGDATKAATNDDDASTFRTSSDCAKVGCASCG
jgi:hypothetical protein